MLAAFLAGVMAAVVDISYLQVKYNKWTGAEVNVLNCNLLIFISTLIVSSTAS